MQFDEKTLKLLKNFSTINHTIRFEPGNVLRTMSVQKNVVAEAMTQSFPKLCHIYDLPQLLGLINLFDEPDVEFGDEFLTVKKCRSKSKYVYSDPRYVVVPPDKKLTVDDPEVLFNISADEFKTLLNGAGQLQLPHIVVRSSDGAVEIAATDSENPTSNEFTVVVENQVAASAKADFQFIFNAINLKFIPGDYEVKIAKKGVAQFTGELSKYWVATEDKSYYKE